MSKLKSNKSVVVEVIVFLNYGVWGGGSSVGMTDRD
jgi:hypothetical protein